MRRILALAIALLALLAWGTQAGPATSQGGTSLELDGNLANGVCDPVDSNVTVPPGQPFQVAVCLFNPIEPPDAFQLHVRYDDSILVAPEREDVAPALDDNPDANAGETTFGSARLGTGWDCSAFGVQFPKGDLPRTDFPDALIACNANIGSPDTQLTDEGALAVIIFVPQRTGETQVTLEIDNQIAGESRDVYSCGQIESQSFPCRNLTVRVQGGAPPQPPPAATSTRPAGAGPTPGTTADGQTPEPQETDATAAAGSPTATAAEPDGDTTNGDDDGGGSTWLIVGIIVGVVVVVALGGGGYILYRRRTTPPSP